MKMSFNIIFRKRFSVFGIIFQVKYTEHQAGLICGTFWLCSLIRSKSIIQFHARKESDRINCLIRAVTLKPATGLASGER
jgi:hypothetical protein